MPKLVDHEERRARVTTAADPVVDEGLNGMAFRALAKRLDCSTTMISHYFRDRTEPLQSVCEMVNNEAARIRETVFADSRRSPIQALEDILPVSERARQFL